MFRLDRAQGSGRSGKLLIRGDARARQWRIMFAKLAQHFIERLLAPVFACEWKRSGKHLVEHHAERVDVGTRINVAARRLLGADVAGRAGNAPDAGEGRLASNGGWRNRPGQAKIDETRRRFSIHLHNQDVGRLEIAVDRRFLVGVLHSLTDLDENFEAFQDGELLAIAVGGNRFARHELHHKVRLAIGCCACVEDFRDCRMIHQRERLAFGLKAPQQRIVEDAGANQFQRNLALNGLKLLGKPHLPHSAFNNLANQAVGTNRLQRLMLPWDGKTPGLPAAKDHRTAHRLRAAIQSPRGVNCRRRKPGPGSRRDSPAAAPGRRQTAPSPSPTVRFSPRKLLPTSRVSHALAMLQSRFTVAGEMSSATAVSSTDKPPKNRSSTIFPCC